MALKILTRITEHDFFFWCWGLNQASCMVGKPSTTELHPSPKHKLLMLKGPRGNVQRAGSTVGKDWNSGSKLWLCAN